MEDVIYAGICLSVPFLLGVHVGRGLRPAKETCEHVFGKKIIETLNRLHFKRTVCGSGMLISATMEIETPDGRKSLITLEEVS